MDLRAQHHRPKGSAVSGLDVDEKPKLGIHADQSQYMRILRVFKANGSATNAELNKISYRYSARIHELRNDGYIIVTNRINESLREFVFKGHRDDDGVILP